MFWCNLKQIAEITFFFMEQHAENHKNVAILSIPGTKVVLTKKSSDTWPNCYDHMYTNSLYYEWCSKGIYEALKPYEMNKDKRAIAPT